MDHARLMHSYEVRLTLRCRLGGRDGWLMHALPSRYPLLLCIHVLYTAVLALLLCLPCCRSLQTCAPPPLMCSSDCGSSSSVLLLLWLLLTHVAPPLCAHRP